MPRTALLALLFLAGCVDPRALSGHYQGTIVGADFLRRGFETGVTLDLTLTISDARHATGTMTTSDGRFTESPVAPLGAAPVDTLADAVLPGGGPILLLLAAPQASGEEATIFVSLGGPEADEVRLTYGRDGTAQALYGVFSVQRAPE
jgi:hypothetical protein